jgi:hypothetical protein
MDYGSIIWVYIYHIVILIKSPTHLVLCDFKYFDRFYFLDNHRVRLQLPIMNLRIQWMLNYWQYFRHLSLIEFYVFIFCRRYSVFDFCFQRLLFSDLIPQCSSSDFGTMY